MWRNARRQTQAPGGSKSLSEVINPAISLTFDLTDGSPKPMTL